MSKFLLFCTVTTCLFALCWSNKIVPTQVEDRTGYCSVDGIYIKEGEQSPSPLGSCNIITCDDAKSTSISMLTCPQFQPRSGCAIGDHDYTKLYPDCCPNEVC